VTRIVTAPSLPGCLVMISGVLAACLTGACGSSDNTPTPAPAVEAPPAAPVSTIGDELSIDDVGIYQGVKASIVKEGELRASDKINAPIIAGRPAFIRVFVKAIGRTRPTIEGELRVKRAGKEDLVLKDGGKRVVPELDEEMLDQTLNFNIAAEDMTADATFSVRAGIKLDGPDVIAFPADGSAVSFGAKTASQKLKVKFVPVSYEADEGASITPDLADLSSLKDTLYKMYPVASVEVSVRAPMKWSTQVKSNGPGWDELLSGIMQLRRADKAERDVYYVGVLTPKASIDQFCNTGGCILGIAPQADERSVNLRVALVLGYKSRGAGSTLAQELAHAMGRGHAPCGSPADIDADFPYGSGGIGVWGYDILAKKMIDPGNRYRDFMSYCGPTWVSDYTYKGLYERMELLTQQQQAIDASSGGSVPAAPSGGATTEVMQSFRVASDGSIHEGPALDVIPGVDSGAREVVSYEGANGEVFAAAKGRVITISGTGSRLVVAPAAPIGATRARIGSFGVTALRTVR
jgi:hypothetical protein